MMILLTHGLIPWDDHMVPGARNKSLIETSKSRIMENLVNILKSIFIET
jgi:hypothetical protein